MTISVLPVRDPSRKRQNQDAYGNIMSDPRVRRGNALYTPVNNTRSRTGLSIDQTKSVPAKRTRIPNSSRGSGDGAENCPPPRVLEPIQNERSVTDDTYQKELESLRPKTPVFVPRATFSDAETSIGQFDLYNFDVEARSLVELLTGQSLEESLVEVLVEEEQHEKKTLERIFVTQKQVLRAESQRLECRQQRKKDEKELRRKQLLVVADEAVLVEVDTTLRQFVREYVDELVPHVYHRMMEANYFYDPLEAEIRERIIPWLEKEASKEQDTVFASRLLVQSLILEALYCNAFTQQKVAQSICY